MSEHGEPWRITGDDDVVDRDGCYILWTNLGDYQLPRPEQLQRIIACVNFCAGVPTEKLNEESLREIAEYVDSSCGTSLDCEYCGLGRTIMDISKSIKKAEGKDGE